MTDHDIIDRELYEQLSSLFSKDVANEIYQSKWNLACMLRDWLNEHANLLNHRSPTVPGN